METTDRRLMAPDTLLGVTAGAIVTMLFAAHLAGGADATLETSIVTLVSIALLAATLASGQFRFVPQTGLVLALLLAAAAALGLIGNWYQAQTEFLQLIAAVCFWSAGAVIAGSRRALQVAWLSLLVSGLALGLLGLISHAVTVVSASGAGEPGMHRLSLSFVSANVFASLMGMMALLSLGYLVYLFRFRTPPDIPVLTKFAQLPRTSLIAISALVVALACLVLSLSRAGLVLTLVTGAALTFAAAHAEARQRGSSWAAWAASRRSGAIALGAGLIVVLLVFSGGPMGARAAGLDDDASSRWQIFAQYWQMWQNEPLTGHGLGSFNRVNEAAATAGNVRYLVLLGAAHNIILQWLIQGGLLGLAAITAVWAWIHWQLMRRLTPLGRSLNRGALLAILAVSAFLILHNLVDYSLEVPSVMWTYAFLLGLGCGIAKPQAPREAARRLGQDAGS